MIYYLGEDLLGLPHQQYVQLEKTKSGAQYLATLYAMLRRCLGDDQGMERVLVARSSRPHGGHERDD